MTVEEKVARPGHMESSRPGELLCQDVFSVGQLKGVGQVYLHVVVDIFSSYAFCFLHANDAPEAAISVLHNDVLPFYENKKIPISLIVSDSGRQFCGADAQPYERYLQRNDIEHRTTKVCPSAKGFVERFNRTVMDEFFREDVRATLYESVQALQADLDQWLDYYNHQRPHQDNRNQGRRPIDTINRYLESAREVAK